MGIFAICPTLATPRFGAEDVVLIDMASRLAPAFRTFTLDTDFLFPETYALIDGIEGKYGVEVERTRSEFTPDAQAAQFGGALWASQPDKCCQLRKVEPLKKKLASLSAWVTGVRRDQAPTRANTKKLEWDAKFGLVKLNPIADWTSAQVWTISARTTCPTTRCTTATSEHRLHLLHPACEAWRGFSSGALVGIQ